jgi:hypothetical protein
MAIWKKIYIYINLWEKMPWAGFEPTTSWVTVQCINPYTNELMTNCLDISNKELNRIGLKPDLSIEIMFIIQCSGHGYRGSWALQITERTAPSIIKLYLFSLYSYEYWRNRFWKNL